MEVRETVDAALQTVLMVFSPISIIEIGTNSLASPITYIIQRVFTLSVVYRARRPRFRRVNRESRTQDEWRGGPQGYMSHEYLILIIFTL